MGSRTHGDSGRTPSLYPSYGLFHAATAAADTLMVLFAAQVLKAETSQVGLVDSSNTIAFTVAIFVLALCAHRLSTSKLLLIASFYLSAFSFFLWALTGNVWIAVLLGLLEGVLIAFPASLIPAYLVSNAGHSQLSQIYGKLSVASNVGGALGLMVASVWLFMSQGLLGVGLSQRTLFLALGVATVVAATGAWRATNASSRAREALAYRPGSGEIATAGVQTSATLGVRLPVGVMFDNSWVLNSLLTALLYLGLGMSFSGTILYMVGPLKMSGGAILVLVMMFRLMAWPVSEKSGQILSYLSPLRLQQLAGAWRFMAIAGLGIVALLPVGPWSLLAAPVLLVASGVAGGALGVAGLTAATERVPERHRNSAMFLFNAITNGAAAMGAWMAGIVTEMAGASALLAISGVFVLAALWLLARR